MAALSAGGRGMLSLRWLIFSGIIFGRNVRAGGDFSYLGAEAGQNISEASARRTVCLNSIGKLTANDSRYGGMSMSVARKFACLNKLSPVSACCHLSALFAMVFGR